MHRFLLAVLLACSAGCAAVPDGELPPYWMAHRYAVETYVANRPGAPLMSTYPIWRLGFSGAVSVGLLEGPGAVRYEALVFPDQSVQLYRLQPGAVFPDAEAGWCAPRPRPDGGWPEPRVTLRAADTSLEDAVYEVAKRCNAWIHCEHDLHALPPNEIRVAVDFRAVPLSEAVQELARLSQTELEQRGNDSWRLYVHREGHPREP